MYVSNVYTRSILGHSCAKITQNDYQVHGVRDVRLVLTSLKE